MQTAQAGIAGYAPTVTIAPIESEKYRQMWDRPEYRNVAPGEETAPLFLAIVQPKPGSHVIDFGAGTGRGAFFIANYGKCHVDMLDFAPNCLDKSVRDFMPELADGPVTHGLAGSLKFTQHDLLKPSPINAEYGYCTDVLEHIPPQCVDQVLVNILQAAQHVFLQISTVDDVMGALIGHPLHLTVQPYEWWHKKLQSLDCVIHWSRNDGNAALFYVTAWQDASKVVEIGELNIDEQQILANVRANVAAGWDQVVPHLTNDAEVMILAGGPSLNQHEDEIRRMREQGAKLVTLNGTYNWAVERGMTPSAQVMVDARPFNARFTKPVVDGCKYLIASQCDPSVLEGLPRDRTLIWHTGADHVRETLDEAYPAWWIIPGGSTVMLRAIPLLRLLGFKKFHLFGFDSCLSETEHHAYAQPENDSETVIPVTVGGRTFRCHAWMVSQAQEFIDLVKFLGDEIDLEIYGDGLINHIVRTGASFSED